MTKIKEPYHTTSPASISLWL